MDNEVPVVMGFTVGELIRIREIMNIRDIDVEEVVYLLNLAPAEALLG